VFIMVLAAVVVTIQNKGTCLLRKHPEDLHCQARCFDDRGEPALVLFGWPAVHGASMLPTCRLMRMEP
jgi:hypothetical protein